MKVSVEHIAHVGIDDVPGWPSDFSHMSGPSGVSISGELRVYFSARAARKSGTMSVPMSIDLATDYRVSSLNRIVVTGEPHAGAFDEHGIFPLSPVRVGDEIWAYPTGWSRRQSVDVETQVGLAISSNDGKTFKRVGLGSVLGPTLHEPFLVGDACVLQLSPTEWHAWYIYGIEWREEAFSQRAERIYKIGHAASSNGVHWIRESQKGGSRCVPDTIGPDECQAMPSVIRRGATFHMFFCYRDAFGFRNDPQRSYRIGHAYSDDLVTWQRSDMPRETWLNGAWNEQMQCYPSAFEHADRVLIAHNGNEFGKSGFGLSAISFDNDC